MDQSTVNADLVDNDEQSLISQLLEKPALFLEITEQERNAIEHLCAALELVKTTDSTECPTLGAQKELYPLVSSFKRFKMGVAGGALKAAEKEAAAEVRVLRVLGFEAKKIYYRCAALLLFLPLTRLATSTHRHRR